MSSRRSPASWQGGGRIFQSWSRKVRSRGDALKNPALELGPHLLGQFPIAPASDGRNITTMPFTPDPRDFYPAVFARTKLLLMPSLWLESFGLVAAEAMLNGIPVLASNRGALPETIGSAGFLFDIPARYTSETRDVPKAEEIEPWVETIIRLWDDAAYYEHWSRAARERAQAWHPGASRRSTATSSAAWSVSAAHRLSSAKSHSNDRQALWFYR